MLADPGLWRNLISVFLGNLGIFWIPGYSQTIHIQSMFRGGYTASSALLWSLMKKFNLDLLFEEYSIRQLRFNKRDIIYIIIDVLKCQNQPYFTVEW